MMPMMSDWTRRPNRRRSSSISWLRRRSSSSLLRSVASRMAAIVKAPSSVRSGLRLISAGNSDPSRRRAHRSSPWPIGRVRGSAT